MSFIGTSGNDTQAGTAGDDVFNYSQGGHDTLSGLDGDDVFKLGATLDAMDRIDGGTGDDTLSLAGDYSAGVVFKTSTLSGIETILLGAGFDYRFTTANGNVAAGEVMVVDGHALGAGDNLVFDGHKEKHGGFDILAGAGDDSLIGGAVDDSFDLSHGGVDTAVGGAGDDTFVLGKTLSATDHIDGGDGSGDTVVLQGAKLTLQATTLVGIENLQLLGSAKFKLIMDDGNVAAGGMLTVDGGALIHALNFNGSAEIDGAFSIIGGAANDVLTGGGGADRFDLSAGGKDHVVGGGGGDLFSFGASFGKGDKVDGGSGSDTIALAGDYSGANALTLTAGMAQGVETLTLAAGNSYDLTTTANAFSEAQVVIDGGALGVSDTLVVDGSASIAPLLWMVGGAGDDSLTGGARGDFFDLSKGGDDTAQGNFAGDEGDTYYFGAMLTAADKVIGSSDFDTISLRGDYSAGVTLSGLQLSSIDDLELATGHSYNLTFTDGVAATQTLFVSGGFLASSDTMTLDLRQETEAFIQFFGGAGDDQVMISSGAVAAHVTLSGGGGSDTLSLSGDLSAAFTLDMQNFEKVEIADGSDCDLSLASTQVTSGKVLTIDASALTGKSLSLDAATVDGALSILGGGGDDTIKLGAHFDNNDHIDGGGGFDELVLSGDYSAPLTLSATAVINVELITLQSGSFDLTLDPDNVAGGGSLTVDGGAVASDKHVTIDGSQIGLSSLHLIGGAGDDQLTGGSGLPDTLDGGAGTDGLTGGGGGDIFGFDNVADSTGAACDMVTDADFDADSFHFGLGGGQVLAVDAEVTTGAISLPTFDADLSAAIGAGQLAAGDAVLFLPDDGDLIQHVYLVVDANGEAGYQAGEDYVVDVSNFTGTLELGDFG